MNSSSLNFGAVSLGGCIINTHQNPVIFPVNKVYRRLKKYCCNYFSFPADRADEIIKCFVSPADTCPAEAVGNGYVAFGKDDSGCDNVQAPGRTLVEYAAKSCNHDLPSERLKVLEKSSDEEENG